MARKRNKGRSNSGTGITKVPERTTGSSLDLTRQFYSGGIFEQPLRVSFHQSIDPTDHYARSQKDLRRIPIDLLRAFADTVPGQAAINRIVDGVLNMHWSIEPPKDRRKDEAAIEMADLISEAILNPSINLEGNDTWDSLAGSLVTDMLITNSAVIERQRGDEKTQPFWLWAVDPERIRRNLEWSPEKAGLIPRYYDTMGKSDFREWRALMDEDIIVIKRYSNSWRPNPPGPLEVAFKMVAAWLGLAEYQQITTSEATQSHLIDIGDVTQEELEAFRHFFLEEVVKRKKKPIVGSKSGSRGVNVVNIGASNDSGLYLQYHDVILRLIALAFRLSARDMNIVEPDNRATADVAENQSFQFAILPMALTLYRAIDRGVVRFYCPGFTLRLADTEPRDQLKEAQTSEILYRSGIVTKNEARMDAGKNSLGSEGDVFVGGEKLGEQRPPEEKKQPDGSFATPPGKSTASLEASAESNWYGSFFETEEEPIASGGLSREYYSLGE